MKQIRFFFKVSLIVIFLSLIIACNSSTPMVVEVTRVVPQTVVVTQIVEKIITATPVPATPTPVPSPTPQVTTTPEFIRWTSDQVIKFFKAAGLEAENAMPMTKEDYGMAPYVAIEGTHFFIPSLCSDCGGRIMSFATPEDLEKTRAYYVELGKESAIFFSWVFVKDNILIQINGDLPEKTAKKYEAALDDLK